MAASRASDSILRAVLPRGWASLEIDFRHKPTYLGPHSKAVVHRDLGTSFALPALAAYDGYYARLVDE